MTDAQAESVRHWVRAYLTGPLGKGFTIRNPTYLAKQFGKFVAFVRPHVCGVEEDDLRVAIAMILFGLDSLFSEDDQDGATTPSFRGANSIPPADMREALLTRLRCDVPNVEARLQRVLEFAIAYGCGKWRTTLPGYGGWGQRWQGAVHALTHAIERILKQINKDFVKPVGGLVGFPQDRDTPPANPSPQATALWGEAALLRDWLLYPETSLPLARGQTLQMAHTDDGTQLTVAPQYALKPVLPGAKAVWTVADGQAPVVCPKGEVTLHSGMKVILAANDEVAQIRVTENTWSKTYQCKVGETAAIMGPLELTTWTCTCGTTSCQDRHRLGSWDPARMVKRKRTIIVDGRRTKVEEAIPLTLWSFLASAIKGRHRTVRAGTFEQSMYYAFLVREGL